MKSFDVESRVLELVGQGIPADIAAKVALQDKAKHEAYLVEMQREREKSQYPLFLDVPVAKWDTKYPTPGKGTVCKANAVKVRPGSLGKTAGGKATVFPPSLWVFQTDEEPQSFYPKVCQALLSMREQLGDEEFWKHLDAIGGEEARESQGDDRALAAIAGIIPAAKGFRTAALKRLEAKGLIDG